MCRIYRRTLTILKRDRTADRVVLNYNMELIIKRGADLRRANLLTINKVAVILENEEVNLDKRKIVLAK